VRLYFVNHHVVWSVGGVAGLDRAELEALFQRRRVPVGTPVFLDGAMRPVEPSDRRGARGGRGGSAQVCRGGEARGGRRGDRRQHRRRAPGGRSTPTAGRAAMRTLLEGPLRPTAVFATSDVLALGVLAELADRNIPAGAGGISVAGFDGVPAAADAGLTTVRQPIRGRGRAMGRMPLDPAFAKRRVVLPTDLEVRTSTGPAPLPDPGARR
jgi:hypothetical protein